MHKVHYGNQLPAFKFCNLQFLKEIRVDKMAVAAWLVLPGMQCIMNSRHSLVLDWSSIPFIFVFSFWLQRIRKTMLVNVILRFYIALSK